MKKALIFSCLNFVIWFGPVLTEKTGRGHGSSMYSSSSSSSSSRSHLDSLPRIAPILGESAIVDKDTGRVYWQGGRQSLFESTIGHSYLSNQSGILRHVRATFFSIILWLSFIRFVADWALQKQIFQATTSASSALTEQIIIYPLSQRIVDIIKIVTKTMLICITCLPNWPKRFLWLVIALYLLESFTCSTRRYLVNSLSCPSETETFMENLRDEKPIVRWRIRCYHYEKRKWLCLLLLTGVWSRLGELRSNLTASRESGVESTNTTIIEEGGNEIDLDTNTTNTNATTSMEEIKGVPSSTNSSSANGKTPPLVLGPSFFTRKVISHEIDEHYKYQNWHDDTIGGIWKQAQATTTIMSAFTKISLHKILLLHDAKSRLDYFQQQANFVRREGGRDKYAEFSTHVNVQGYKEKILAVRPPKGFQKVFNIYYFWIFTLLGLTVPYRIKFSNNCDELRVAVVKETSVGVKKVTGTKTTRLDPKQSWFASPKTWFGSSLSSSASHHDGFDVKLHEQDERKEKFRKHMQEIALYQQNIEKKQVEVKSLDVDIDTTGSVLVEEEVENMDESSSCIEKTNLLQKSDEELVAQIVQEVTADAQDASN